jgi:hypothetical protein
MKVTEKLQIPAQFSAKEKMARGEPVSRTDPYVLRENQFEMTFYGVNVFCC